MATASAGQWLILLLVFPSETFSFLSPSAKNQQWSSLSVSESLFPSSVYETIEQCKIAVIPNFIPPEEIVALRSDAQSLWDGGKFSTDALASYGSTGKFDPSRDRAVLRLNQWKDTTLGSWDVRQRFGYRMNSIRNDLAYHLDRPHLATGLSTTMYGNGSTEISYTRFGPGAFLRRHVDEHHEELKGRAGWTKPTRRSISWLIYLNDRDWNSQRDGGQLRCFSKIHSSSIQGTIGSQPNGDLQIGWLRPSVSDPVERPVYLDSRLYHHPHDGHCRLYMINDDGKMTYVTKDFTSHPILYVAGAERLVRTLFTGTNMADRFQLIEQPKGFWKDTNYAGTGENPASDEVIEDVDPTGGTLVLFDSVTLPHEVLATKNRERWATSGWFHEDQQPAEGSRVLLS